MSGHTKGPWEFNGASDGSITGANVSADDGTICYMTDDLLAWRANAALIAAAPEMYDWIRAEVDGCPCAKYVGIPKEAGRLCVGCTAGRALLAKATGAR